MNGVDSTTQLSHWLDPDSAGGMVLDGIPLMIPEPEISLTGLKIYPNPASGILHLESAILAERELIRFAFLDSRGRPVMSRVRPGDASGHTTLDISILPNGFYLLKVQSEEQLLTGKFIKL